MKWYLLVMKNYTKFTGRARRKEFWRFVLVNLIIQLVIQQIDKLLGLDYGSVNSKSNGGILSSIYSLVVFIPTLAVTVRRFHDIGKSGWVYFRFLLVVFIATILLITHMVVLLVVDALDMYSLASTPSFLLSIGIYLLVVIPLAIWMIVLLCRDSQPGSNKFGPNPKERISDIIEQQL